jgi:ABC-type polysaccharide/polyol phosphate export permease
LVTVEVGVECRANDPTMLPPALKAIVYLLPLTYTTIGLRAAAYQPLAEFPWYAIPILLVVAIGLALVGAQQFSSQQD